MVYFPHLKVLYKCSVIIGTLLYSFSICELDSVQMATADKKGPADPLNQQSPNYRWLQCQKAHPVLLAPTIPLGMLAKTPTTSLKGLYGELPPQHAS